MPWYLCTGEGCGKEHRVSGTRGTRIADHLSPCCNAPLVGKTTGQESKAKGRTYERCVVPGCGKRRLNADHPDRPFRIVGKWGVTADRHFHGVVEQFEAGSPVCHYWHSERIQILWPCACGAELWRGWRTPTCYAGPREDERSVELVNWYGADGESLPFIGGDDRAWDHETRERRPQRCPSCGKDLPRYVEELP